MHDLLLNQLENNQKPLKVIVVGLGFMGFGFISSIRNLRGIVIPLLISRRPEQAIKELEKKGFKVKLETDPEEIEKLIKQGILSISDDLSLIEKVPSDAVLEITGTVAYGTKVALKTLGANKHLITMNPELQSTVGDKLKEIADKKGLIVTDVVGDQPGSLANLISHARLMGFKVLLAGNMKRFMDKQATKKKMEPWAKDKGLATYQTVSFTDGTKQAIEMNLVANHFNMDILQEGMVGPEVETVHEALEKFDWDKVGENGVVDFVIGRSLFPGVFIVVEHTDPEQKKYLRYLGLGDGPRYVLFEPYHLCHLEVGGTIAKALLHNQPTIQNVYPKTKTIAVAKCDLKKGVKLEGIGGDHVYGIIQKYDHSKDYLPVGLAEGAILKVDIKHGQKIRISEVELPHNEATSLANLH